MFKAIHTNPKYLLSIFQVIENINPSITMQFTQNGIYIQVMNVCHTCIFNSLISDTDFESYKIKDNTKIGITLKYLVKILDLMDPNDTIEFKLNSLDILEITRKNKSKTSIYKIKLLDLDYTEFDSSQFDLDYDMKLKVNFSQFQNDIKEMMILEAENVSIINTDKKITFASEGEHGILEIEVNSTSSLVKSKYELIKNDIALNMSVCLSYLTPIFKMSSISHDIIISASENKPLNIEIETNDSNKHSYFIAPKY